MSLDRARHLRQIILAEVGETGQLRIGQSTACVADPGGGPGLAHELACAYAHRAGFCEIRPGVIDVDALAPIEIVSSPCAREVLAGSRAALAVLRNALNPKPVA